MEAIFQFIGNIVQQAEFWAVSTTGFGIVSVVSLLWNNKTNLTMLGQKVAVEGLKKALSEEVSNTSKLSGTVLKQAQTIEDMSKAIQVLNANIYILSQAANIGVDNKQLIQKNYSSIAPVLPEVKVESNIISNNVEQLSAQLKVVEQNSSLEDLLKKI
jgi:hypothetical protein